MAVAEDEEQGAGRMVRGAVADRDDRSDGSEGSAESG